MAAPSQSRSLLVLLLVSALLLLGLVFDYMPAIIEHHVKSTFELGTNAEVQAIWSKPPFVLNAYYWLYDIENAE